MTGDVVRTLDDLLLFIEARITHLEADFVVAAATRDPVSMELISAKGEAYKAVIFWVFERMQGGAQ